jgi:hypothetical protein
LIIDLPEERTIKILDRKFTIVGSVPVPEGLSGFIREICSVGKTLLILGGYPPRVWRLDLDTKRWKRVWRP